VLPIPTSGSLILPRQACTKRLQSVVWRMGCGVFGAGVGQYPWEKEITFPPFTCLEADGEPSVERSPAGEIVVFPLKVTLHPPYPSPTPHIRCRMQHSIRARRTSGEALRA
jgi:hypothetical protein